jgi:DNA-binding transcriptional LysR family regulator
LIDYPWILPGAETALRRELERVFVRQGLALPENRVECTSILTVRQLLVETDVIAALPMLIARDESRISALPISLEPMSHTIGVTRLAGHSANPSTAVLLEELDAVAARMRSSVNGS